MSTDSTASRSYYPLADVLEGVIDKLSNPSPFALTTGLRGLDSLLRGGLTIGSVSAVAGRPSMGRGEFARNVAFSVAKQGHGVLYFSPERSRHMIALDGLAQILELEPYWLRMPSNQAVARDLLNTHSSAIASLSELPIVVDDTPSLKQEELRERIVAALRLQHSQETPIKLVVVDSVECLHFSPSANADLLGSCMTMLAELAKTEEIHVLCTVPVLRQVEERESHVPRLFDLWGEGIVEKFCDPVIAIYRESYYYPEREDDTDQARILVLRNSWPGVTGSVIASFRSGRFGDAR